MTDDQIEQPKPLLPVEVVVKYENSLRSARDFWLFRTATNVLRQNIQQIENYRNRYKQ